MCVIEERVRFKTVKGYKVAVKHNGKYYSPATGIQYKVGPVKIPTRKGKRATSYFNEILKPTSDSHISRYAGFTAIFTDLFDASRLRVNMQEHFEDDELSNSIIVLEMILSDGLHHGRYRHGRVYLGKHIDALELYNV
jgi:hypothetical protein